MYALTYLRTGTSTENTDATDAPAISVQPRWRRVTSTRSEEPLYMGDGMASRRCAGRVGDRAPPGGGAWLGLRVTHAVAVCTVQCRAMAERCRIVLLAALACWSLSQSGRAERYTAGTLRQYLREVVQDAMATYCPQPPTDYTTQRCPTTPPSPACVTPACDCDRDSYRGPYSCAKGYTRCGEVCYQRVSGRYRYSDAEEACRRLGGRLAVPRTDEEDLCSRALALGSEVWLGITDPFGRGTYLGSDGESVDAHSRYWDGGQPDRYTGEDSSGERCVELFPAQGWHDRTCKHRARPLCQQN